MTTLSLEEYENECYWDYVTLYDGRTANAPALHAYCVPNDTTVTTSNGPAVLVVFTTDESFSTGGFALSWNIVGSGQGG